MDADVSLRKGVEYPLARYATTASLANVASLMLAHHSY